MKCLLFGCDGREDEGGKERRESLLTSRESLAIYVSEVGELSRMTTKNTQVKVLKTRSISTMANCLGETIHSTPSARLAANIEWTILFHLTLHPVEH
jgi:hypothetical protein